MNEVINIKEVVEAFVAEEVTTEETEENEGVLESTKEVVA